MEKKNKLKNNKKINNNNLKDFFNSPKILFLVFSIVLIFLLFVLIRSKENTSKFYFGDVTEGEVQIKNIHYFTSKSINYFYSTSASYNGKDSKVYKYDIGYYVKNNDKLIKLATYDGENKDGISLKEIVAFGSSFSLSESRDAPIYFSKEVIDNFDKLHFIISASSNKDNNNYDINIDIPIKITKVI